jgi:hypothetical protein
MAPENTPRAVFKKSFYKKPFQNKGLQNPSGIADAPSTPKAFEKIIGTLILKKVSFKKAKPIPAAFMERILESIKRIYDQSLK